MPAAVFAGQTKKAYRGGARQAARAFLADHLSLLGFGAMKHLHYRKTKKFRGVRYITFSEMVEGVPVYGAQYVVHLKKNGHVNMINGSYYPNIQVSTTPSVSKSQVASTARSALKQSVPGDLKAKGKLVIYHGKKQFHLAWKLALTSQKSAMDQLYMVDAHSGNILINQNGLMDAFAHAGNRHTNYLPHYSMNILLNNILTGDGNAYPTYQPGSSLTDVSLHRLNGNGHLTGTYANIVNDEASRAYSSSETFQYGASNTHFDEVNLYYHIDKFRHQFVNNFDTHATGFTQVTAHAHTPVPVINGIPNPNASFNPNNKQLYFDNAYPPEETKDFSESDQVIYHEYSHDVIYHINNDLNSYGRYGKKGAINEGTSDYFAGSKTGRALSGNYVLGTANEDQWRSMSNPQPISSYSQYESVAQVDVHNGGEFFSSILWDLRGKIGNNKTNTLVFKALYGISDTPDFLEFRDCMISADHDAYNGVEADLIQDIFADKGAGNYAPPSAPSSLTIINKHDLGAHPHMTWSGSDDADHYKLYRRKLSPSGPAGPWTAIASPHSTHYTDTQLILKSPQSVPNRYVYKVTAVGSHGVESYPAIQINPSFPLFYKTMSLPTLLVEASIF